jgi:hypothetical protein
MKKSKIVLAATVLVAGANVFAQTQNHFLATSVTGQLTLTRTVNALQVANTQQGAARAFLTPLFLPGLTTPTTAKLGAEVSILPVFPHPSLSLNPRDRVTPAAAGQPPAARSSFSTSSFSTMATGLPVTAPGSSFGFNGMTHYDQRQANSGNQFSVEPPNPSIATANGFIVEGVNNAFRVYTTSGTALMPTITSNQLFGVSPAIDRTTGLYGVFPTDMRVYFDQDINRWFVLQRSQDNDINRNPLNQSHLYLAVSQTGDPTGTYNIYVMDSSNLPNTSCPCVPDYPQIGSDQYGFYISANEYNTSELEFVDATILAMSKTALASGTVSPATYKFTIQGAGGYEFAIQPATTPPGASHFLANGGVEYFVSSQSTFGSDSNLAIWALSNTATLQSANPALLLTQTTVPTLAYFYPSIALQKPGPLPYGDFLGLPLAFIDGGTDSRILSVVYSAGRLFATFATEVVDETGQAVVGGGYVILSPTFRNGSVGASVVKQGYLMATNNNVLRPSIAVNAQGRGAISFTLVGPDYYPSSAFVSIDATASTPSVIQIAGAGTAPEDGFTGYPGGSIGIARWGDYSTAVTGTDGTIWMVSEYIPNSVRTQLANWGTFVSQFIP